MIPCLCWCALPRVGRGRAGIPAEGLLCMAEINLRTSPPAAPGLPASGEGEKANQVVETLRRAGRELLTSRPAPCFSWPLLFGAGWGGQSSKIIVSKLPLLAVLRCTPQQPGMPKSTPAGGKQAVFLAPFPCMRLENSSQQATQPAAPNSGLQSTRSCTPSATQRHPSVFPNSRVVTRNQIQPLLSHPPPSARVVPPGPLSPSKAGSE